MKGGGASEIICFFWRCYLKTIMQSWDMINLDSAEAMCSYEVTENWFAHTKYYFNFDNLSDFDIYDII